MEREDGVRDNGKKETDITPLFIKETERKTKSNGKKDKDSEDETR